MYVELLVNLNPKHKECYDSFYLASERISSHRMCNLEKVYLPFIVGGSGLPIVKCYYVKNAFLYFVLKPEREINIAIKQT